MKKDWIRCHPTFKKFLDEISEESEISHSQATYVIYLMVHYKHNTNRKELKALIKEAMEETILQKKKNAIKQKENAINEFDPRL